MSKYWKIGLVSVLAVILLTACGESDQKNESENADTKIQVISSFTLITNMVQEIGGNHVAVHNLVPIGTDPHEYDPLPEDIKAATDADVLFYNGLNLEGGEHGWFAKMMDAVGQDWELAFNLSDGVEPLYITSEGSKEEEINPHGFLDPVVGIQMAENVRDALIKIDPSNQTAYEKNAAAYLESLQKIDAEYKEKINDIPEEDRILITSERAYQYLAKRYGLQEGYIWSVDTEENGSPDQIKSLLQFIKEQQPPVLFVETNVDQRPMNTISNESGLPIYGEIYSDEIGKPGEPGDTYIDFLQYNIDMIYDGLTSQQ